MAEWSRCAQWHDFSDGSPAVWHFSDNGHIGPPLVLLPGALGSASSAWRLAEAFNTTHRVIAVTYPGGLDSIALADGLAAMLQSTGIGTCAVWGSSYGAWWAQGFANRHPSMVRGLWLGNTFVDGSDVAGSALFDLEWLEAARSDEVVARWNDALLARPDDSLRAVQLHLLRDTLPATQFHGRLRQVARAPVLPVAATSHMVISDSEDDPIIPMHVRDRVCRRYPQARHVHLPGGGHYPHVVALQPLVEAMNSWLSQI